MSGLKFIAISGTTSVTENCYLYEQGDDILMVDCGVGFPDPNMFGVDLTIPDFSYVKQNASRLRGVVVTHGHEDHIGAIPFLLSQVKTQVYATKLVAGFIEDKLKDYGIKGVKINIIDPERDVLTLGSFKVTPFRVSHSVPDSVGLCIETFEGKMFHVPDYKFDWTPVDRRPFDISKLAILASGGALALASDALGATSPGFTESELFIEERIGKIVSEATQKVFFTTISSNISRMQQALNVARKNNRQVAFVGRSISAKAEIARKLGYLHYTDQLVVPLKHLGRLPAERVMYIISGSYGQSDSALTRVALGEHDFLSVGAGDTVIYSSDPAPPGSKEAVDSVVDKLIEKNVDVHYYDIQEDLHVSGHGSQEDIKMLMAVVKPKFLIPVGGTTRHNKAYAGLAVHMSHSDKEVFGLKPGEVLEIKDDRASVVDRIPVKQILVDGLGVGDVGNVVLRDRQVLATDGVAIVLLQYDSVKQELIVTPEIISRGFVFEGKAGNFLNNASEELENYLKKKKNLSSRLLKIGAADFLEKYFWKETRRRPMVLPVVIEV